MIQDNSATLPQRSLIVHFVLFPSFPLSAMLPLAVTQCKVTTEESKGHFTAGLTTIDRLCIGVRREKQVNVVLIWGTRALV
jgi:hypothetical protein